MDHHLLQRLRRSGNFDQIPLAIKKMAIITFIYVFGSKLIGFFVPVYINNVANNYGLAGVIVSFYGLGMVFLDIPIGDLLDRVGRRLLVYLGMMLRSLAGIIYGLATGAPLLVVARLVDGLGVSFSWDAIWTLTRDKSPSGLESESLAVCQTGNIVAAVLAPITAGYIALNYGLRPLFFIFSVISLIAYVAALKLLEDDHQQKESVKDGVKDVVKQDKVFKKSLADLNQLGKEAVIPLVLVFLKTMVVATLWFIVPLFSQSLNADYLLMGTLFAAMYVPGLLRYWQSELSDWIGDKRVVIYFSLAGAAVSLPLILVQDMFYLFVLVIAVSTFVQGVTPSIGALLTKATPKDEMGELTGVFQTFKHLGFLIGPLVAGFVAEAYWVSAPFAVAAVLFGAMVVISLLGDRR